MSNNIILKSYSQVKTRKIDWIWEPYIASGKLTVLQGDPGVGKSTLALVLCSVLASGENLYKISGIKNGIFTVIYQSTEDSPEDTIKPKLNKLKAKSSNILYVENDDEINLNNNSLENVINKSNAKLLILDPIQSFFKDGENMNTASSVRKVLTNISKIANKTNCGILMIGHLNKAENVKDLYRGLGSIDFTAIARSVLYLKKDETNPKIRIMYQIKNSLSIEGDPQAYRLDDKSGIAWLGTYNDVDIDTYADVEKNYSAKDILLKLFDDKELIEVNYIKQIAEENNISFRTFVRAKKELEIDSVRENNKWYWKY